MRCCRFVALRFPVRIRGEAWVDSKSAVRENGYDCEEAPFVRGSRGRLLAVRAVVVSVAIADGGGLHRCLPRAMDPSCCQRRVCRGPWWDHSSWCSSCCLTLIRAGRGLDFSGDSRRGLDPGCVGCRLCGIEPLYDTLDFFLVSGGVLISPS
jgi:hypothetical protein